MPALRRVASAAVALVLALPAGASAAEPGITPTGYTTGKPVPELPAVEDALRNAPAGHRWVRLFFDWDQTERAGDDAGYDAGTLSAFDTRIAQYRRAGIQVAVTVQGPPAWAPSINTDAGAAKYAEFMRDMAARWRGQVAVWELWNEPDDHLFWPDGPKVDRYAAMLQATYPAVRSADPAAKVIVGGLVGNDYEFVERLYDLGAGPFFDGVGVHTDTSCRVDPPGVYYREEATDGRVGRWSFTGYREVHRVLARHGDGDKPIYMTEIGWAAAADQPCEDRDRPRGVTAELQARYLKEAFACVAADPYVKMASWFTLQDHVESNRYGLYDVEGAKRPALAALKAVGDGTGAGVDRDCGGPIDEDRPVVRLRAPASYFTTFPISATITDPTSRIRTVELWVDGRFVRRGFDTPRFSTAYAGAKELSLGAHTIEVRAMDVAKNVGSAQVTVTRLDAATAARVATARLKLDAKAIGRRFAFRARAQPPADGSVPERPRGGVVISMQRRGKGRWAAPQRLRFPLKATGRTNPFTTTKRRPGRWRVWAELDADAPYRRVRTAPVVLRLR